MVLIKTTQASTSRRFGTDLSNVIHVSTNSQVKHSVRKTLEYKQKNAKSENSTENENIQEQLASKTNDGLPMIKYDRDFLLSFQMRCLDPLPGLPIEICRPQRDLPVPIQNVPACKVQTVSLEWKPKEKKEKPRETDPKRLASRQKQIDIGMNTTGYKRFLELVPESQRTKDHPRIPDKFQICSKRSWDGQIRKWRRMLHMYDPNESEC